MVWRRKARRGLTRHIGLGVLTLGVAGALLFAVSHAHGGGPLAPPTGAGAAPLSTAGSSTPGESPSPPGATGHSEATVAPGQGSQAGAGRQSSGGPGGTSAQAGATRTPTGAGAEGAGPTARPSANPSSSATCLPQVSSNEAVCAWSQEPSPGP